MADPITGVAETPLQYLLRRIPRDAIYQWTTPEAEREVWQLTSNSSPIGRLAHEAADRLDSAASPPAREEAPELALQDAVAYGVGFIVDGKRVSPDRVTVCRREEAPAEGAGEMGGGDVIATVAHERWDHPTAPQLAYAHGWNDALRNRTSEPEAGEAWKDQRLSRIERVKMHRVAFGSDLKTAINAVDEHAAVSNILAKIPAPATVDKLRVAGEALEAIADRPGCTTEAIKGSGGPPHHAAVDEATNMAQIAEVALAALNEQPQ